MGVHRFIAVIVVLSISVVRTAYAAAPEDAGANADCSPAGICAFDAAQRPADAGARELAQAPLIFFWGIGCPHCEQAERFLETLAGEQPELRIERVEVRRDARGRDRFVATMQALGAEAVGIPTFVVETAYVVGFTAGTTENQVRDLVRKRVGSPRSSGSAPSSFPGSETSSRRRFRCPCSRS
jgi:hypothetical protein